MAIFKIMIELQDQLFDLFNLKSVQKDEEYNGRFKRMDYIIWINKDATILEYKDIKLKYASEEERDLDLARIKDTIDEHETAMVLRDPNKILKKYPKNDEGLDDDEYQDEEV